METYEEEIGGKRENTIHLLRREKTASGEKRRVGRIFTGSGKSTWRCMLWIRRNIWRFWQSRFVIKSASDD